jgi:hypothetical protein
MASFSPRTHGDQRESPYDIIPRIILDTFNPDLPKRTVVVHIRDDAFSARDFHREGNFVPYGTLFVTVGVDMVIVVSELAVGTPRKSESYLVQYLAVYVTFIDHSDS